MTRCTLSEAVGAPDGLAGEHGAPVYTPVAKVMVVRALTDLPDLGENKLGCHKCRFSEVGCRRCRELVGLRVIDGKWQWPE